MRKVFSTLALIATTALALMACSTESATNEVNNFQIHRGTNMSHWLSQSAAKQGRITSRKTISYASTS